jgi:carbon-monoxide dehydrogenase large subunit
MQMSTVADDPTTTAGAVAEAAGAHAGRFVGARIPRQEDARFLTGRGAYVDDIVVPNTLHVAFVRSDIARGTIIEIDTSEAEAMPGVVAVLLAADLNHLVLDPATDQELSHFHRPYRLLADGDVRFVGEAIAMVVAESRYLAEDAAEAVVVDVEPLPPVVDFEHALDADAPLVHADWGSNLHAEIPIPDNPALDEILSSAAHVVTETFRQHRYNCVPMETRGALASWDPVDEQLTIWSSTQNPHSTRAQLARLLGLDEGRIRAIMPDVGGAFGLKMFPAPEEIMTVMASRRLGQPVKWIEDRREHLMAGLQSRQEMGTFSLALDEEGRFLGGRCEFLEDSGAQPAAASSSMILSAMVMPGPYRLDTFAAGGKCVFTNTAGRTGYRGPWMIETVVREQLIDVAAHRLGLDPLELRRRNLLRDDELPYTMTCGLPLEHVSLAATVDQAAEMLGYDDLREQQEAWRDEGRLVGIGMSVVCEPTSTAFGSMSSEAATVRIGPRGSVDVTMSSISNGQGLETTVAQVVADELGVAIESITIYQGDTATAPFGGGSGGSRAAVFASGSAREAAQELRQRVLAIAAHMLEAAVEDLEIVDARVQVVGTPAKGIALADIATKSYFDPMSLPAGTPKGLEAQSRYKPDQMFCTWSNSCHMTVVEVDPVTGGVEILRYVVSEDCGVMINPNVVEGQIAGGVVQGLGGVLLEHLPFDEDGNPLATTFVDYLMPTAADVPEIEYGHVETPAPTNPGGHKGLGEGGAIASPPALINAVADALRPLGAEVRSQPLGPSQIVALIEAASAPAGT